MPGFGGTVSALRADGVNHLASAFPTITTFGWLSPWHGGLTPVLVPPGEDSFPGRLTQQRCSAEPLETADARGVVWRGVRQRATLDHEALRGLTVEIDTLTVGGSPLVRHALRVVNATPVGMHGTDEVSLPCPADVLHDGQVVVDLIYNPLETALMVAARERGARAYNGVSMLVFQAAEAFELWTGRPAPVEAMLGAAATELQSRVKP